jgi:site-specific DNA recombinase
LRKRGGYSPRCGAHQECPREQWIEIPVPALVSEDLFELAQEKLQYNKKHSPRRTIEPTLLQGMLVCKNCGYAYYRTSTRTSKTKLYYSSFAPFIKGLRLTIIFSFYFFIVVKGS